MRRGWRLLRQHGRRGRSGQVSAVATILALLLFVSFFSTFILGTLDQQMAAVEFQHQLQVEDQLSRLQTSILAAANAWNGNSTYLSSPVTLSSTGVPPFGTPSAGSLQVEPTPVAASTGFGISNISRAVIGWNSGTSCFASGSGICTTGAGNEIYNFSGNKSTVSPTVAGCTATGCNVIYNVTGNSNTLSLSLSGANIGHVLFQVSGNWDNLTVNDAGTCNIRQSVSVIFSGNNDSYTLSVTACTTGAGANLNTTFVGSSGTLCPYGDASNYDLWKGATWGSSVHIYQNLTWRNALGHISAPNSVSQNGGNDELTFSNQSGYYECLFTNAHTTGPYTVDFLSGVRVNLENRYSLAGSVAYDQGAVIYGVVNGGSIMVSPPTASWVERPAGVAFSIDLVSIVSVTGTATGYGTAAVISSVLSVQEYQITDGHQGPFTVPYFYLNITTAYPQAWATYWTAQSAVDPTGVRCVPGVGVTAATCLTPPLGRLSTIIVPINAYQFSLTTIEAQISIY